MTPLAPRHAARSVPSSETPAAELKVAVGVATRGRPGIVRLVVDHLQHQTLRPASIIVSCASREDAGGLDERPGFSVVVGPPGLARQRNAVLDAVADDVDLVVFFDDDFVPHRDWLAAVARTFAEQPDVACITGDVIADGIMGPGIGFPEACAAMAAFEPPAVASLVEGYSPYGCNMALRRAAIGTLRFDERLVLYGWLEDRDFGGALARKGLRLLKIGAAAGIHMGIKKGRVAGLKLGYSQVVNPIYLHRKGTMTRSIAADHVMRNVAANLRGFFRPEPYVDRRGRLHGNVLGVLDLLRGRIAPERAQDL